MPIHNRHYMDKRTRTHNPASLSYAGALLEVEVNIPQPLINLLTTQNQPIPSPKTGLALIDTGASRTSVEITTLSDLGINPIGISSIGTAAGTTQCQLFPARLNFPALQLTVDFSSVLSVNLKGQKVGGNQIIVLIGRDILSKGLFVYSGNGGFFSLAL